MSEVRAWVGREGKFRLEVQTLLKLLADMPELSISLRSGQYENFNWIVEHTLWPREGEPGDITLLTSGTTGEPKSVTRRWNSIVQGKRGRGSTGDRWLLTYSPARWAGISVIAHCLKHECDLVIPNSLSIMDICGALKCCTHVSFTPSLFRKALVSGFDLEAPDLTQVTFGGESASQSCLDQAKRLWPHARISHVYASTELGDLASASDGIEGYPRLPGVLAENGELFVNGVPTGDLWKLNGDRYLYVGRNTDVINVGGAKVSPFETEKIINSIEGVFECRVFGVPSPLVGALVCAEYCGTVNPEELAHTLRGVLPKYAVPRLLKVESISLTDAGKVGRR